MRSVHSSGRGYPSSFGKLVSFAVGVRASSADRQVVTSESPLSPCATPPVPAAQQSVTSTVAALPGPGLIVHSAPTPAADAPVAVVNLLPTVSPTAPVAGTLPFQNHRVEHFASAPVVAGSAVSRVAVSTSVIKAVALP